MKNTHWRTCRKCGARWHAEDGQHTCLPVANAVPGDDAKPAPAGQPRPGVV